MNVTAYRITKKEFAASIWSGIGARDFSGRWNSRGVAVIYTAQNKSLAALEQLVHLIKPRVLEGYVIASISFDDSRMQRIHVADLPALWKNPVAPASLRKFGDRWLAAGKFPALAVPSAIIPGEWNYLFNPAHPECGAFSKSRPERFVYDSRLG